LTPSANVGNLISNPKAGIASAAVGLVAGA